MPPRHSIFARGLYAALLHVLPSWLRHRAGDEMLATFDARVNSPGTRWHRCREILHELGGLARVAVVARLGSAPAGAPAVTTPAPRTSTALETLRQDLRFAIRSMRRKRAVTILAVFTLALGIGTSSAMFSVIDSVLLKPLPFERPEQIVVAKPTIEEWKEHPSLHDSWQDGRFSPPELAAWLAEQRSFVAAGGYTLTAGRVPRGQGSERVPIADATTAVFTALGVRALHGRLPDEHESEPVVLLTHRFWQSHHGGDPAILGRDIRINDRPVRVIGILPPEFELVGVTAQLWRPLRVDADADALRSHYLIGVGRLRENVTIPRAEEEMARIVAGVAAPDAGHVTHRAYIVSPLHLATEDVRTPLLILASASLLLLVAACANVALLLLGTGADRLRELAVRQALGARRTRIALQLLIESVVLGVTGALLGVLVALGTVRLLVALSPGGIPRIEHVGVDVRTFGFAALLAIATGVLVGCFPALSYSRVDAAESLRSGAATPGRSWLQRGIVVTELALATVLLVAAALLTRTMAELQDVDPGFEAEGLITAQLSLPGDRFYRPGVEEQAAAAAFRAYAGRLLEAVRTMPGVEGVALSSDMPYSGDRGTNAVEPEGYQPAQGEVLSAARRFVSGNYFDVMRIRPLQGRLIEPADDRGDAERVMVVTDRFAERFWPDGRWLDRRVSFWDETYRVIGIVADTREHDLRGDEDELKFYVPTRGERALGDNLLIRTSLPSDVVLPALRERIWTVDPAIVITDALPMADRIARSLAADRYRMRLMVAFSGMAALFSLLGVYGVMSRAVARRRREIAMRMALGAQRRGIVVLVLREAGRIGTLGALVGLSAALVATRVLESVVWGVPRLDPLSYVGAAAVLLALTMAAACAPARRAAAVDPMAAIRS